MLHRETKSIQDDLLIVPSFISRLLLLEVVSNIHAQLPQIHRKTGHTEKRLANFDRQTQPNHVFKHIAADTTTSSYYDVNQFVSFTLYESIV
jgi:hypothetical protein